MQGKKSILGIKRKINQKRLEAYRGGSKEDCRDGGSKGYGSSLLYVRFWEDGGNGLRSKLHISHKGGRASPRAKGLTSFAFTDFGGLRRLPLNSAGWSGPWKKARNCLQGLLNLSRRRSSRSQTSLMGPSRRWNNLLRRRRLNSLLGVCSRGLLGQLRRSEGCFKPSHLGGRGGGTP